MGTQVEQLACHNAGVDLGPGLAPDLGHAVVALAASDADLGQAVAALSGS